MWFEIYQVLQSVTSLIPFQGSKMGTQTFSLITPKLKAAIQSSLIANQKDHKLRFPKKKDQCKYFFVNADRLTNQTKNRPVFFAPFSSYVVRILCM